MQCTDSIIRGTTYSLTFTLKDSAGEAIDITGYELFFTAKTNLTDTDANAAISIDVDPGDITNPTEGKHIFTLTNTDTDITAGSYYYDIKWKDTDGNYGAIPYKRLKIVENVTDRIS